LGPPNGNIGRAVWKVAEWGRQHKAVELSEEFKKLCSCDL
jgi:hypothetical protein